MIIIKIRVDKQYEQLIRNVYDDIELDVIDSSDEIVLTFKNNELDEVISLLTSYKDKKKEKISIIMGKDKESKVLIKIDNVYYFEGINKDVYCYTKDSGYLINERLYQLDDLLSNQGFVRISKSVVVNIMKVIKINPFFGGRLKLELDDGQELEVSRSYLDNFKRYINNF